MATKDYYKGLTIQFEGDTTKVSSALGNLNKDLRQSQSAARALDTALRMDPKGLGLIKDRADVANRQIETMRRRVEVLKSALEEAKDPEIITRLTHQTDIAEAKLKSLTEDLVKLNVAAAKQSGFGAVVAGAQDLGAALTNVGEKAASIGDRLTVGVTAPIVAFTTASVGAATTIDSALTDVRKTVDGTEQEYQALKEAAIEYSKTNAVTADEVLQVQALGAQLGYARDELEMIGRVGTGLDIATDMNAEQATTELAQFANITGMAHDKSENYASTIVALGNSMATTESKTSAMAQRVAAAGTQVGMSESEILGFSAALSSMGIEAEAGGTAISTIMSNIDKDVATGSEKLKTWAAAAGMSADEFAQAWHTKPAEALSALLAGLGSATEAGGNMSVMLEQLGIDSIRQTDMMKRLSGNSDLLAKAIGIANTAWQENSALTKEVANRNDSLEAKMQMVQNRVTAMLEKVGKPVADALLDIVNAAEPLFEMLETGAKAFSDMDESQQKMIVSAVAAAAALGPMLSIGGRIVETLGGGVTAIGNFGEGVLNFTEAIGAGMSVTESFAYAAEGATTSVAGLAATIPVLVGALAALDIADSFKSMFDEFSLIEETTTSAAEIAAAATTSMEGYAQAADTAASSTATITSVIGEANDSLRETARYYDEVTESLDELASNSSAVDQYAATIKELASAGELTEQEQARLANAVQEYNEITGAAIEVTDAHLGELSLLPGQIDEVTEAYKRQAEQQAYGELYNEAVKEQVRQQAELKRVTEELGQAAKNTGSMIANSFNPVGAARNAAEIVRLTSSYDALRNGVARAASDVEYFGNMLNSQAPKFSSVESAMVAAGYTGAQYASLTESQLAEIRAAFDGTIDSIAAKLSSFGVSVGGTGGGAVNAARDVANDVTNALSSIPATGSQIVNDLGGLADDAGGIQNAANDGAIKAQQRANEKALKQQQKAYDQEYKALQKKLAAQLKIIEKEYAAEEDAQRKANEKALKELRKRNDEQEKELKKRLDARVEARKKALDAEVDAEKKANAARLKDLKKTQEAATKAFKKATNARIKEIEREYKAQLKQLEENDGTGNIDKRIKQLEAETDAEKRAQTEQERNEKISELQREVERAKSRRRRAEAEKELNDYLAEIAAENREQERKDEIERLEEQKSVIKEETDARKEALKERYDAEKEQYQQARSDEADVISEQQDAEYEKLKEHLDKQTELRKEKNAEEIEALKEHYQERMDHMEEQHELEEEKRKERLDAELESLRESHEEQLELMRESNQEQLDALKEYQQEQLDAMREAQQDALDAMRDSYGQQAGVARSGGAAVAQEAGAAAQETAKKIKEGLAPAVPETKKTAEELRAEFLSKISIMPGDAYKTGDTSGHTLVERLNAHIMPTTDATKALRNAALRGIEGLPEDAGNEGNKAGDNFAKKLEGHESDSKHAGKSLYDAAMSGVDGFPLDAESKGDEGGSKFVNGLGTHSSEAQQTASEIAQHVTDELDEPKNWTYNSGSEAGQNFFEGLQSWAQSIWDQAAAIAEGIANYLHFTVPDKGPLRDEDEWGAHLIENYANAMRSKAYLLEDESKRMAQIVEDGFSPDLAMRYDASLNYQRGSYVSAISSGQKVGKQEFHVSVELHDVALSTDMDIRNVSREIATQTAAELAAQLG